MFSSHLNKSKGVERRGPGRAGNTSAEDFEKQFVKYEKELIVDGEIAKLSSVIFKTIADELKIKSTVPHKVVYQAYKRYLLKKNSTTSTVQTESENNARRDEQQVDSDSDGDEPNDGEFTLFDSNFKVHENDDSYDVNIKNLGLFSYSDNEMRMQSEWSDTLNDIVWQFSRHPCAWRFDKHQNVANEKIVFGTCRSIECKANLYAYTECNQSKLKIVIKNFNRDAKHIEKRAMKNSNKEKIAQMLKMNKPSFVHAELANELLQSTDYCPAHLPNSGTLRKIKQRENEKNYRDIDPVRSLCMMKSDSMFHKSIADIGLDPFYCFFSTPEQIEWLRLVTRYKRCEISFDSSGIEFIFFFLKIQSLKCKEFTRPIYRN